MVVDDTPVVYAELPVIESWRIRFDYWYRMIFLYSGNAQIDFKDLSAITTWELRAATDGRLFPQLHDLDIYIANSKFYMDSIWG